MCPPAAKPDIRWYVGVAAPKGQNQVEYRLILNVAVWIQPALSTKEREGEMYHLVSWSYQQVPDIGAA